MQKSYDFYLALYPALKQYPRSDRYSIGAETNKTFFEFYELLIVANKSANKAPHLYEADKKLEVLRFRLRIAKDLQILKLNTYERLMSILLELGRMLGGWIKSCYK